ncbi:pyrimidine-nucleoside phosphorylase, partial [Streptococcus danieliae]|nr:pyrimidine-nucleoside phosphorylase [Streptococcus danieliae]
GLVFEKKVGDRVEVGQVLARIYANSEIPKVMLEEFLENVKIGKEEVEIKEIIEIVR